MNNSTHSQPAHSIQRDTHVLRHRSLQHRRPGSLASNVPPAAPPSSRNIISNLSNLYPLSKLSPWPFRRSLTVDGLHVEPISSLALLSPFPPMPSSTEHIGESFCTFSSVDCDTYQRCGVVDR